MSEDIINALRLASDRVRATVGSPNILDEAANELEKLNAEADRLARRNALLVAEIETLRDEARRHACVVEACKTAMQKAERDMEELRKSMIDVDIRIETEADFRRNPKSGNDMTTLSAIKVKTEFIMTPEFLEEAHRGGFQYQALGASVESSLRNAVEKAKDMDILSLASFYPMRAR